MFFKKNKRLRRTNLSLKKPVKKRVALTQQSFAENRILDAALLLQLLYFVWDWWLPRVRKVAATNRVAELDFVNCMQLLLTTTIILCDAYSRHQIKEKHNTRLFNAREELTRARQAISIKGKDWIDSSRSQRFLTEHLDALSADTSNPTRLNYQFRYSKNHNMNIWWSVGKGTLLMQLQRAIYLNRTLPRYFTDVWQPVPLCHWGKLLPHRSAIMDMPSKTRYLALLMGSVLVPLLNQIVNNLFKTRLPMLYPLLYLTLYSVFLAENVILNERRFQYRLEGYNDFFPQWLSKTPTCVGQQLGAEFILYRTSQLTNTVRYLVQTHEAIANSRDRLLTGEVPIPVLHEIKKFMLFFKEHTNLASVERVVRSQARNTLK